MIADNVLEHHLKDVYWIGGSACSGKTTMSKIISEKYDFTLYNSDEKMLEHKKIASFWEQPAMKRHFVDWEWYFNRPVDEYTKWLNDATKEQMSMIIVDLLKILKDKAVIVEGVFSADMIKNIVDYNNAIFLYAKKHLIRKDYFNRDDKKDILSVINNLSDPDESLNNVLNTVITGSQQSLERTKNSNMKYLIRNDKSSIEKTLKCIENHFNL